MFTLFGANRSGSAAIEIALTLCGADHQLVAASAWEEGAGQNELKRLNPLMQVPTLVVPDGAVLTESAAILIHLGLEFPSSGLISHEALERAQQLRALAYITTNCYASIGLIDYPERWLPDADPDQLDRLVAGARRKLRSQGTFLAMCFTTRLPGIPMRPALSKPLPAWSASGVGRGNIWGDRAPSFTPLSGLLIVIPSSRRYCNDTVGDARGVTATTDCAASPG